MDKQKSVYGNEELAEEYNPLKIGNAVIPQAMVRSRMQNLDGAILAYALEKAKSGSGNVRNSTNYLIS